MNEFVLIFRESKDRDLRASPEDMQGVLNSWMTWMADMAAQNKLADRGNRLSTVDAKTIKPNNIVADGPFTEIKEYINGYIVLKTENIDEAVAFAKGCPILKMGGSVEVRTVIAMDTRS